MMTRFLRSLQVGLPLLPDHRAAHCGCQQRPRHPHPSYPGCATVLHTRTDPQTPAHRHTYHIYIYIYTYTYIHIHIDAQYAHHFI